MKLNLIDFAALKAAFPILGVTDGRGISTRALMRGWRREANRLALEYYKTGRAQYLSMFANHVSGMLQRSRELGLDRKETR